MEKVERKSRIPTYLIVIILVVVAALAAGAYYFFGRKGEKPNRGTYVYAQTLKEYENEKAYQ